MDGSLTPRTQLLGRFYRMSSRWSLLLIYFLAPASVALAAIEYLFGFAANRLILSLNAVVETPNTAVVALPAALPDTITVIVAVLLLRAICQWFCNVTPHVVGDMTALSLRREIAANILSGDSDRTESALRAFNHDAHRTGEAAVRAVSFARDTLVAALLLLICLVLSWQLSALVLIALSCVFGLMNIFRSRLTKWSAQSQDSSNRAANQFARAVKNLLFIRVSGMLPRERAATEDALSCGTRVLVRLRGAQGIGYAYLQACAALIILIVGFALPYVSFSAFFTPIGFLYVVGRFLDRMQAAYTNYAEMIISYPYVRSLDELLNEDRSAFAPESKAGTIKTTPVIPNEPLGWSLDRVSFSYPKSQPIFADITLTIPPGSFTVISGPSGKGKSTFLRLLLGVLHSSAGATTCSAGSETFELPRDAEKIYPHIGYISSDHFLIPGTVRENLLYGSSASRSDEEIAHALCMSQCNFVWDLPGGTSYEIAENADGLSTGQKQRICFARALLRDPQAIIIDEGTANVDLDTEEALLLALESIKGRTTIICVSHRPRARQLADLDLCIGATCNDGVITGPGQTFSAIGTSTSTIRIT